MKRSLSLACLLLLTTAPTVRADVLSLDASMDNTLYETGDGSLSNAKGQYFFVGLNMSGQFRRGLIQFDIAGAIPAGSTINSASLSMFMSKTNGGGHSVRLHRALDSWGESTSQATGEEGGGAASAPGDASWIHRMNPSVLWATAGGDFAATSTAQTTVSGIASYTWNGLATDVSFWLANPSSNFGWFVIGNEGANSSAKRFNTRENMNTSLRPMLTIDFDPPASLYQDFCFGDGGDQMGCTDCPCTNNAPVAAVSGCLNSSGTGTRLVASGSPSVSLPSGSVLDLRFSAVGASASSLCVLNSGAALAPTNPASPCFGLNSGVGGGFFDGLRCAVVNTQRHGGRPSNATGEVGTTTSAWGGEANPVDGIGATAGFTAGITRYFQIIHRDSPSVNCMTGLNTSQAVEVVFTP